MTVFQFGELGEPGRLVDRVADDGVFEAGRAPMWPAIARPADTPMPNSAEPSTGMSSSCNSRAAASAPPHGSGCSIGTPKMASAASPWNLLTKPPCRPTVSTTTRKNSLSKLTTSAGWLGRREVGGADQVDEQHRDVALLPAQFGAALQRTAGHVFTDVATEQVTQPLPLGQVAHHVVETGLQQPELAGVVDLHVGVVVSALHLAECPAQLAQRVGDRHGHQQRAGEADQQRRQREQQDRAEAARRAPGAAARTWSATTASTIATSGTPVDSAQVSSWRLMTPGVPTFSGSPARRAATATGRRTRSACR